MRVSNGGVSGGEPVILNIYDMFWTNDYTGNVGLGVYHSGVEGWRIRVAVKNQYFRLPNMNIFNTSLSSGLILNFCNNM